MTLLADAIRRHATEKGDAVALDDGETRMSWAALDDALPRLVGALLSTFRSARRGPVAIALDHGMAACLLDLALAEACIPALQLPPFFTRDQSAHAMEAAGATALIAPGRGSSALERELGLAIEPRDLRPRELPLRTAKISFTSGSTGRPKGLCLSLEHQLSVAGAVVARVGTPPRPRHLAVLPPGILLESVAGFYGSILAGGAYIARPQAAIGLGDPFRPDFDRLVDSMAAEEISSTIVVPEYLAGLVGAVEARHLPLPSLALVAVGGARTAPDLLQRAAAAGLPVLQGYGLTECASVVALEQPGESERGSVGSSLGVNRITLAEDGEILIDGPLFLGAIGEARPPGPLRTGDIGRIDAGGRLWIEGRKSNLIVTGYGRNVSPEWVESLLLEQPAIAQVMVRGDGAAAIDALIVPASSTADLGAAVAAANARLPAYARVARWRAVPPFTQANLMLTGNGRLCRSVISSTYGKDESPMTFFDRLVTETSEAQARFAATPQLQAGLSGRISRVDYLAYLAEAYHHVRHTVPLMREARAGLAHRPELVAALDDYIVEEDGHERWILDDIAAAGGEPDAVATSAPSAATQAMIDHAYRTIRDGNPAGLFGMVYVLEGTSIAMATQGAEAVRAKLGLPASAFRYLSSHGALDQQHMLFFRDLMGRIDDPEDQRAIVDMAREMFGLFGGLFAAIELETERAAA